MSPAAPVWVGPGRSACYLVSLGYNARKAIDEVRAKRPGSIETKVQEEAVKTSEKQIGQA